MRTPFRSIAFATVLLSLFSSCSDPQPELARIARVEGGLLPPVLVRGEKTWTIQERMKAHNIPGVSVAVFYDGHLQWARGYGVMDNDTKEPVTEKTLFVAGSISKPVGVAGALRLVQDGKMSLDANINDFLTTWKLPENEFTAKQPVTLRLLMSHNAGVTVHGFPGYVAGTEIPTIVQILNGEPPANTAPIRVDTEPGTLWRYAGGGTTIMQLAIADVSGSPFETYLQKAILDPIGMSSSSYDQNLAGERLAIAASGHKGNGKVIPGKRNVYPEMAAAGLWTTPTDLCIFAIEIGTAAEGKSSAALEQEYASLMVTGRYPVPGGGEMALGFFLEDHNGYVYYGHGGADEGFVAGLIASRDGGYGAAIMTNSDGNAGALIREIRRSIAAEYGWEGYLPEALEAALVGPEILRLYTGTYKLNSDALVRFEINGDRLAATPTEGRAFTLIPISNEQFVRQDRTLTYTFGPIEEGMSRELVVAQGAQTETASRVADDTMVPSEMLQTGRLDEAVKAYKAIYARDRLDPAVAEQRLNSMGYNLLSSQKTEEAIAVFKLNVELYPKSFNVYDSLGEAYMESGERQLAIRNYEKSVRMNPDNTNGKEMLKKLKQN